MPLFNLQCFLYSSRSNKVALGFFGVFGPSSQCLEPKLEEASRCQTWVPRSPKTARTDFEMSIASSLLVRIVHMICRWKDLSKIFNLICNVPHKTLRRNIHVIQSPNEVFFYHSSNCFEFFILFHFLSLLPINLLSKKSPIKIKNQSVLT